MKRVLVTKIATNKGLKSIEEIQVADSVWAFDETTGIKSLKVVYNTFIRQVNHLLQLTVGSETLISGKIIEVATIVYGAGVASRVSRASAEVRAVAAEVETGVVAKNGSTLANRSGQQMHKLYKVSDVLANVRIKEFRLPSGKHIDFIDLEKKIIYELKPNNPRAIKQGYKQLEMYQQEVESIYGKGFKTVLDTY